MNTSAVLTLVLTAIAALMLITDLLRPDIVALIVLVVLGITGVVGPEDLFAGFGGSAVITLIGISMIGAALHKTGVTLVLGRWMQRLGNKNETTLILVTFLTSAALSLFMNNIAVVGILLPAVMTLARSTGVTPSRLLLPLAYGTILGGTATLFTTSNIIVSGSLKDAGYEQFGVLDFLPIGLPLVAAGAIYMITAGRRMLPNTKPAGRNGLLTRLGDRLADLYNLKSNLSEIMVRPESPFAEKTIQAGDWRNKVGMTIIGIIRNGQTHLAPKRSDYIHAGDRLIIQGQVDPAKIIEYSLVSVIGSRSAPEVVNQVIKLAEVIIPPHSTITGKSLRELEFRERYHLTVVAIWRENTPIQTDLTDIPLLTGDALLVQGTARRIRLLHGDPDLILLEEDPDAVLAPGKIFLALGITLVTLVIAAIGVVPVAEVILAGAILLVVTGCMNMNDAYRAIEWKAIFLIAGMWPLSTAIRDTGLASMGVNAILNLMGNVAPLWIALCLILVAMLFTQVMSGQVAALVVAPLALAAAASAQIDARALSMAVALGCSLAFATPYGHPVNIMVMSSGGYNLRTYARIGIPLTILSILVILAGLAIFWGL